MTDATATLAMLRVGRRLRGLVPGQAVTPIARMDQRSRKEDLIEQLGETTWSVAVVGEAHRVPAHYSSWAGED